MSKISEKNRIGERLGKAVKLLGYLSYPDFIAAAGMNKSTFYTILNEHRKPSSSTAKKLYDMGINVNYVIDGIGGPLLPNAKEAKFRLDENLLREQKGRYGTDEERESNEIPQNVREYGTKKPTLNRDVKTPAAEKLDEITRSLRKALEAWETAMAHGELAQDHVEEITDLRTQILISLVKLIPQLGKTDLKLVRELVNDQLQRFAAEKTKNENE